MKQGTTPTIRLFIKDYDLSNVTAYITIEGKKGFQVTYNSTDSRVRTDVEEEGTAFYVRFTQEDTLGLEIGTYTVEIRWIESDGTAMATEAQSFNVTPALYKRVIEYLGGGQSE